MRLPESSFSNIGNAWQLSELNSGLMVPAISYYFFPGFIGDSIVHLQCTLAFRNAHITKPDCLFLEDKTSHHVSKWVPHYMCMCAL